MILHPAQREVVEKDYHGPAPSLGLGGYGKVYCWHYIDAVYLARSHPESRILLSTFSEALANALRNKLMHLISNELRSLSVWKCMQLMLSLPAFIKRMLGNPQSCRPTFFEDCLP